MDMTAMFKLSYGLFVLSAAENGKDNGCIVNTVTQVTSQPNRVTVTINKSNFTHDMVVNTGKFTVSVLTESVPMDTIKRFGFQSGKEVDKFSDITYKRDELNLAYLTENVNAVISCKVISTMNMGTHTQFYADVVDCIKLSDEESVTYSYYQNYIKPKPQTDKKAKGFRCTVCGYIYEGDTLPDDFICPICKHPASDFVKIDD